MLTELTRKEIATLPFIAYKGRPRLSFLPVAIALCALSIILCCLSLIAHSTLPVFDTRMDTSLPPKLTGNPASVRDRLPPDHLLLFP